MSARLPLPRPVCTLADLDATGAKEFDIEPVTRTSGFVVRSPAGLRAYVNSCPHLGLTLNFSGDRFFDPEGKHLLCPMHGALFRPEDGYCVWGPCKADWLEALPIELRGDEVWLLLKPGPGAG